MAKAKQTPPAATAAEQPTTPPAATAAEQPTTPPAATAAEQGEATALRNVPFVGPSNKVLAMVHANHGEAHVGDWQVEEFAALGWALKD